MDVGTFDHFVCILKPVLTKALDGTPVTSYEMAGSAWASKIPASSRKLNGQAGQQMPGVDYIWRTHYDPGLAVDGNWRLMDDDNSLHEMVGPAVEIERRAFVEFRTVTVPASAEGETA